MTKRMRCVLVFALWFVTVSTFFNSYAYEIVEFNTRVRVYLLHGKLNHRVFDENGLPISYSSRIGEFVSPFYVVHYGLIYSERIKQREGVRQSSGFHWHSDPSHEYWNVPPPENPQNDERFFHSSAKWLVDNLVYINGGYHYVYEFDWPYANYPGGGLNAPWWSGLTDGYSLMLLLRAYDYFGEDVFLQSASKLYSSLLKNIADGGSINLLNNRVWIEEYVDPARDGQEMSFVLNGMIYATYGVLAYEQKTQQGNSASELLESIEHNLHLFDRDGWSMYDHIGTASSIKYHNIHFQLLDTLADLGVKVDDKIVKSWRKGFDNPGLYFLLRADKTVSYWQFVLAYFFCLILPVLLIKVIRR